MAVKTDTVHIKSHAKLTLGDELTLSGDQRLLSSLSVGRRAANLLDVRP
ncbi:MAG TPA: hypothetical protein VFB80_15120 [Pirellulaceae bacterium]|nr:hypothetical protein [Pirellulaceae bacterium]